METLVIATFFDCVAFFAGERLAAFLTEGFEFLEATLSDGFLALALTFLTGVFFADVRLEVVRDVFLVAFFGAADFTGFLAAFFALSAFLGATVLRLEVALRVGFLAI